MNRKGTSLHLMERRMYFFALYPGRALSASRGPGLLSACPAGAAVCERREFVRWDDRPGVSSSIFEQFAIWMPEAQPFPGCPELETIYPR